MQNQWLSMNDMDGAWGINRIPLPLHRSAHSDLCWWTITDNRIYKVSNNQIWMAFRKDFSSIVLPFSHMIILCLFWELMISGQLESKSSIQTATFYFYRWQYPSLSTCFWCKRTFCDYYPSMASLMSTPDHVGRRQIWRRQPKLIAPIQTAKETRWTLNRMIYTKFLKQLYMEVPLVWVWMH